MSKLLTICLMVCLAGCASSPVVIKHYVLGGDSVSVQDSAQTADKTLVIESIKLAGFLRQSGLVMQKDTNQLHLSKTHLWAEPLDDALPKALQIALQQQSDKYIYYLKPVDWINKTDFRLRLRIDNLHATNKGEVIASGRYQLISTTTQQPLVKDFSFKRDLDADGYAHAVQKIDELIKLIAADVLSSMSFYISAEKSG